MEQTTNILFTILLPIHRGPNLLPYAVVSVLKQTIQAFELFIICDGPPSSSVDCANELAKHDSRIRVFDFPKGQRNGEAHRHAALMQAKGKYVACIADDDLWFPNHLEEAQQLLLDVDFGNLTQTGVNLDGSFYGHPGDLGDPQTINKMLTEDYNFFGTCEVVYTLAAYRSLPVGWSPAPTNIWSDLFMWRKFLSHESLKFGTRLAITSLHFPTSLRTEFSIEQREQENRSFAEKIKLSSTRDNIAKQMYALPIYAHKQPHTHSILKQPRISVVIPVYNGEKYIKSAIESVLRQSLAPIEIIVVNDGSTDNSIQIIEAIESYIPIRILNQPNAGQSAARNHGVSMALGDYIALLDQDDIWYPAHLEQLSKPFEYTWNLGWTYSNLDEIDENGRLMTISYLDLKPAEHPKKSLIDMVRQDMYILPSASLILKRAFKSIDGFDENLCGYEDDDLFVRLFAQGWKNHYINEPLSQWRIYSESTSHSNKMNISRIYYAKKLITMFPDKPKMYSFWARDYILPRLMRDTYFTYIAQCLRFNNFESCNFLLRQLEEYVELLPKESRSKWTWRLKLLKFPRLLKFIWERIILLLPLPIKRLVVKRELSI